MIHIPQRLARPFALFTAIVLGWGGLIAGDPVYIVRDGQANAEIVISEEPARMTSLAASELQAYIEKISGARLPIVTDASPELVSLYVGVSGYTEELGLDTEGLEHGAFRMDAGPDWLALLGPDYDFEPIEPWGRSRKGEPARVNEEWDAITGDQFFNPFHWQYMHYYPENGVWEFDDAGTLNAVHAFLRDLGVRWYAPGEIGEVVPQATNIVLPTESQTVRPDFPVRNLRYYFAQHGLGEVGTWNLRLGFNPGNELLGRAMPGHGIKFVMMRPEMRAAHPEMYALYDGERDDMAPCLSSELVFEKHVHYVRTMLDQYGERMVNIDMPDGYGRGICQCELCKGKSTPERGRDGSMSDYVWGYIDRVAREVYKSHPDRMVGALAYSTYRQPPLEIDEMSPNLAITECRGRGNFHDTDEQQRASELRQQWLEKLPSKELYVWEYYLHARPGSRGLPVYFTGSIADDLRELKGVSQGDLIEVYMHQEMTDYKPLDVEYDYDPFAVNHLNLYVTSRLWWDADQNLDELLEEYYQLYYGPAAEQMRAFVEYGEGNWPTMRRDAESIAKALELIEAAQGAVDADTIYGQRVALVAEYVEPLYSLQEQLGRVREGVPRARVLPFGQLAEKELDGRLDNEHYWPRVRTLPLVDAESGAHAPRDLASSVRVFRAGDTLYFGIYCSEPDMENLNLGVAEDGTVDIRQGDFVEVLLETTSHSYYRITVNPAGVLVDVDCGDGVEELRWDSGAETAVHLGDDYWSVELKIPLVGDDTRLLEPLSGVSGRMPSATYPWYFNVGRQRVRDGNVERLAYSPTGSDSFEELSRFAEMWSK